MIVSSPFSVISALISLPASSVLIGNCAILLACLILLNLKNYKIYAKVLILIQFNITIKQSNHQIQIAANPNRNSANLIELLVSIDRANSKAKQTSKFKLASRKHKTHAGECLVRKNSIAARARQRDLCYEEKEKDFCGEIARVEKETKRE